MPLSALHTVAPAAARPRIARGLVRRIDRLARRAHRFHRYAHHPLCAAYASELVPLGRRARVCRGCTFVALGATVGALAVLQLSAATLVALLPASTVVRALLALLPWLALLVALSRPLRVATLAPSQQSLDPRHGRHRARSKLVTRALPSVLLAALFVLGLRLGGVVGVLLATSSTVATSAVWLAYRKRGPDRTPCTNCPEGPPRATCSGFAPIVQRERAFARVVRGLLAAHAHKPTV